MNNIYLCMIEILFVYDRNITKLIYYYEQLLLRESKIGY